MQRGLDTCSPVCQRRLGADLNASREVLEAYRLGRFRRRMVRRVAK